jgi:hypothetical protein
MTQRWLYRVCFMIGCERRAHIPFLEGVSIEIQQQHKPLGISFSPQQKPLPQHGALDFVFLWGGGSLALFATQPLCLILPC